MLFSEQYAQVLEDTHATCNWGVSSRNYIRGIVRVIKAYNITSVVDYGAGQKSLKNELPLQFPELKIQSYDPGIPSIARVPDPAELVVCTDVLEHVEPECLDSVLEDLQRVMIKVGYFYVATRPANQLLADGRNAHLIVESIDWWQQRIAKYFDIVNQNHEFFIVVPRQR